MTDEKHKRGSSFPINLQLWFQLMRLYLPVDSEVEAPPELMQTGAPSVEDRLHTEGLKVPGSGLKEGLWLESLVSDGSLKGGRQEGRGAVKVWVRGYGVETTPSVDSGFESEKFVTQRHRGAGGQTGPSWHWLSSSATVPCGRGGRRKRSHTPTLLAGLLDEVHRDLRLESWT